MIRSKVEWVVWTTMGILLLGAFILHYADVFRLPEAVLVPIVFLLGIYAYIYADALAGKIRRK
jgi:hypothetical protein